MASAAAPPLVARSPSGAGSLIAVHHPDPSPPSGGGKTGLVRCYDGAVSSGSLKFTLRFPLADAPAAGAASIIEAGAAGDARNPLGKLVFADDHLCGLRGDNRSVLIWDLHRGVLVSTIDVRGGGAAAASGKKKKRKSSVGGRGDEVLCDVAASGNQLYALIFFPDAGEAEDDGGSSQGGKRGKCRLYQYDLSSDDGTLVRKIKVGSVKDDDRASTAPSFGVAISADSIVLRLGNQLRVLDLNTGGKVGKIDFPSQVVAGSAESNVGSDASSPASLFAPLCTTSDGRYFATRTGNNQVLVVSNNDKAELQVLGLLSPKDATSPVTHLEVTPNKKEGKKELTVLSFQALEGTASLYDVPVPKSGKAAGSLVPRTPRAQLRTAGSETAPSLNLIQPGFHPRAPHESIVLLFQRSKKQRGGSAAGSGTDLPAETLPHNDLEGAVTVGTSLLTDADRGGAVGDERSKRKAEGSVAMAPGDRGREATSATDLTAGQRKRAKKEGAEGGEDDEDCGDNAFLDDLEEEEDGEQGQSIAERLALLSSAMEQTDEEDDEEDDDDDDDENNDNDAHPATKFNARTANSETLTTLLTQALTSNDSKQLNIALQVTDRRLVEGTVRALQVLDAERHDASNDDDDRGSSGTSYISILLAQLVRRMVRRHALVMPLGVWVRAILAATARSSANQVLRASGDGSAEDRMAKEGREMAMKLGPLKNFLNERVESFPQLLRLEGRLALLSQQF